MMRNGIMSWPTQFGQDSLLIFKIGHTRESSTNFDGKSKQRGRHRGRPSIYSDAAGGSCKYSVCNFQPTPSKRKCSLIPSSSTAKSRGPVKYARENFAQSISRG